MHINLKKKKKTFVHFVVNQHMGPIKTENMKCSCVLAVRTLTNEMTYYISVGFTTE